MTDYAPGLEAGLALLPGEGKIYGGTSPLSQKIASPEGKMHGEIVKQALAKLPKLEKETVYRGVRWTKEQIYRDFALNDNYEVSYMMSTSKNQDKAEEFLKPKDPKGIGSDDLKTWAAVEADKDKASVIFEIT
jgi:hypothetical protein